MVVNNIFRFWTVAPRTNQDIWRSPLGLWESVMAKCNKKYEHINKQPWASISHKGSVPYKKLFSEYRLIIKNTCRDITLLVRAKQFYVCVSKMTITMTATLLFDRHMWTHSAEDDAADTRQRDRLLLLIYSQLSPLCYSKTICICSLTTICTSHQFLVAFLLSIILKGSQATKRRVS